MIYRGRGMMKQIIWGLILGGSLCWASGAEAVEMSIPEAKNLIKFTGIVEKVDLKQNVIFIRAKGKTHQLRGAHLILKDFKAGDKVLVIKTERAIKYIRKIESPPPAKKKPPPPKKKSSSAPSSPDQVPSDYSRPGTAPVESPNSTP